MIANTCVLVTANDALMTLQGMLAQVFFSDFHPREVGLTRREIESASQTSSLATGAYATEGVW